MADENKGEKIPAPPADFVPRYIAKRFVSQDIRRGAEPPAWAKGWDNVVDTGDSRLDVEIAKRLNEGRRGK